MSVFVVHFVSEIAFNCISTEAKDASMNVFGFLSNHLLITLPSLFGIAR